MSDWYILLCIYSLQKVGKEGTYIICIRVFDTLRRWKSEASLRCDYDLDRFN